MSRLKWLGALALGLISAAPALAQTSTVANPPPIVGAGAIGFGDPGATFHAVSPSNPLPTNPGYQSATPLIVGAVPKTPGRAFMASCSSSTTATITLSDGSTASVSLLPGTTILPLSVTAVPSVTSTSCSLFSLASVLLSETAVALLLQDGTPLLTEDGVPIVTG